MTNFEKVTKNESTLAKFIFEREYDVFENICKSFQVDPKKFFKEEQRDVRIKELYDYLRGG